MASSGRRRLLLEILETDTTFERRQLRGGQEAWVGKCLHCGTALTVALNGDAPTAVTVEHILPKNQGGTDALENLALACARCNHEKGVRHDVRRKPTARALEVVEQLRAKRMSRWRDPPGGSGA